MIDLHSHILPKMDDGSSGVEESLALLEMLKGQGVETVVATPHFYPTKDTPEAFLARRQTCWDALSPELGETPSILLGAEVAYFDGIAACADMEKLQIGDTRLLLLEMPFRDWTDAMVEEVCAIPERLGLYPVLAHVHRYCGRKQLKKYLPKLLSQGVYLQCSPEGLLEGWNKRWLMQLVKAGHIHFLGSDCHNITTRPPRLNRAARLIRQKLGEDALDALNAGAADLLNM